MPQNLMQSLKFMPLPAIATLAAILIVFLAYAVMKSREVGQFRKKYMSFASRDLFIEDVINSLGKRTTHTFLLFLALIISVLITGSTLGGKEAEISGPGGKEEMEAKLSNLQHDFDELKEDRDQLKTRYESLSRTGDVDSKEKQLSESYKAALVNYFYLLKCNSANVYDGMAMTSMLSLELAKSGSPTTLIWATVEDARNLYNREYSKNVCDKAAIYQITTNQKQFVDSATKNIQAALSFTPPNLSENINPEALLSKEIGLKTEQAPPPVDEPAPAAKTQQPQTPVTAEPTPAPMQATPDAAAPAQAPQAVQAPEQPAAPPAAPAEATPQVAQPSGAVEAKPQENPAKP